MVFSKVDILPDLVMSGAFGHIDSLMVDWTDSLNDGMQPRSQVRMVIDMAMVVMEDWGANFSLKNCKFAVIRI